jgi:hypothetical protein
MQHEGKLTSSRSPVSLAGTSLPPALSNLLPSDWPIEVPLARITTCGALSVEVVQDIITDAHGHLQVTYCSPDAQLLSKKGTSTAFLLLSLLISQPGCFAPKDWLSEKPGHLYDESDEEEDLNLDGLKRVDNVVWQLRRLLCPPRLNTLPQAKVLRRHLVSFHRATAESGPGYRLASAPLVWVDVEAMSEHVKQARALEQFGNNGRAEWRAAYDLGMRGPFWATNPTVIGPPGGGRK